MDELQQFVSEQNIARFVDQLRRKSNAVRQDTLKRLLLEEENRFAAAAARLQMVDRNILDGAARIANQARLVSELKSNGRDAREAERILRTLEMIQGLFVGFRASSGERPSPSRPSHSNWGYSLFSLTRAFSVVNCQSALAWCLFR